MSAEQKHRVEITLHFSADKKFCDVIVTYEDGDQLIWSTTRKMGLSLKAAGKSEKALMKWIRKLDSKKRPENVTPFPLTKARKESMVERGLIDA